MRRALVLPLVLALVAGCQRATEQRRAAPVADGGVVAPDAAPAPPPDLSFVRGAVYVAEQRDGRVRTLALMPDTATWTALDGGGANVFPSGQRWQGGLLVIAAEGEAEADHVEQLAVVRDAALERVGPRARLVRNPVVAADGRVLVVETSERSDRDLYRLDAAGAATRLTDNREGNFEPALSPDGTSVAFTSSRDGDAELYRVPTRGGAATRLTAFHKDDWSPVWAPDGAALVFLSDREGAPRLFVMKPDGTALRRLTAETTPEVLEDQPRFAPDGKHLAYIRGAGPALRVRVLDLATGAARALTPETATDSDFAWSPDGAYLVVIRHALAGTQVGTGAVAFVRVSDGAILAADATLQPMLVRWVP